MRLSPFFALLAAPTVLACSSSSPAKKAMDAATDLVAIADRPTETKGSGDKDAQADASPTKDSAATDGVAADSPAIKDAPAADAAMKDGSAGDLPAPADGAAADTGSRDSATIEVMRDVPTDAPFGCLAAPTVPPACNDDPVSAAIQGVCQSDGTCLCNGSFALNPDTGRCGYRRDAAMSDGTTTAAMCTGTYDACQCLCCSTDRRSPTCYFPTLGETIDEIRATYEASKNPANCGAGSCSSVIVQYVCCMPADPEPPSSATYVATGNVGGIDHLAIAKTGANCASLSFSGGAGNKRAFNIDGGGYWTVSAGSVGPCGDAGAQAQIQGALGTMSLRKAGSECVVDLHATLFTIDNVGTVTTARMDSDGIAMPRVFAAMSCP